MTTKVLFAGVLVSIALMGPAHAERGADGELKILSWQAPSSLNPYLSGSATDTRSASLVLEPLARYDNNGVIIPALAESIPTLENGGISEDLKSITWKLKPGVLWSDGTPLTAEDVKFTADYCLHPNVGCAAASRFKDVDSVDVVDALTVKINFKERTPFAYVPMVGFSSPILQKAQFQDCLGEKAPECVGENFGPIGTGPFAVTEFRPKDVILMEANANFREAGKPAFSSVLYKGGGDATAAARAVLQTGEFDYALNLQVAPEVVSEIMKGGKGDIQTAFGPRVEIVYVNLSNPDPALGADERSIIKPNPRLDDVAVRRALSMALDRELLVEIGYGSAGAVTCNLVPAPALYVSDKNECGQDIAAANALLDEAGWVHGADGIRQKDGIRLELDFQTSTNSIRQSYQSLLKEWWKDLGVQTNLRNMNSSVFFSSDPSSPDTFLKFYSDLQMFGNSFAGTDPQAYLGQYLCGKEPKPETQWKGQNYTRFCDPAYDAMHAELAQEANLEKRSELARALNDILIDNQVIIPLVNRGDLIGHANTLVGVKVNPWDSDFWNAADWSRAN